jgi:LPS export ABC transporter protein LptC
MAFFISMEKFFLIVVIALITFGCNQKEHTLPVEYEGPLQEAEEIELLYTEQEKIKVKMTAALLFEFKTGDREFPKGLYLEFFNEDGTLASTLKANHAFFFKSENKWRARGKVEVVNKDKNEQLNTEELYWFPGKEQITTESFVTIRLQSEVIYGEGLEAKQDMSSYVIKNPQGEFQIDENSTDSELKKDGSVEKKNNSSKKEVIRPFSQKPRPKPADRNEIN